MKYLVVNKSAKVPGKVVFTWKNLVLLEVQEEEIKSYHKSIDGPGLGDKTYFVPSVVPESQVTGLLAAYNQQQLADQRALAAQALLEQQKEQAEQACQAFISNIQLLDAGALTDDSTWPAAKVRALVLKELNRRNAQLIADVSAAAGERFGTLKLKLRDPGPPCSRLDVTRSIHKATKIFVKCVQLWCQDVERARTLNLVRGVDLLSAVGKLSPMINKADIQDRELPALPSIQDLIQFHSVRRRGFTRATHSTMPIDSILSFLDRASFLRLTTTNSSFLYAFAFHPPTQALAQELSEGMPRVWLNRARTALSLPNPPFGGFGNLNVLAPGAKARGNQLAGRLRAALEATPDSAATVPWGAGKHANFEIAGAVRLNFCEDVRVVRSRQDKDDDLQYSSIALTLDKDALRTHQVQLGLQDLRKVKGSFIGEACILMVSLEGTMNNLMVADMPFASLLIACGHLTWQKALYAGPSMLAAIPFASGKGAKPQSVMSKQAALLKNERIHYERLPKHLRSFQAFTTYMAEKGKKAQATPERYDRELALMEPGTQEGLFDNYMAKEYELHGLFFDCFFPEVYRCPGRLPALYASLVTVEFLCRSYGVNDQLKKLVDQAIDGARAELLWGT